MRPPEQGPEVHEVGPGIAVLMVGPIPALARLPWRRLIEIAPRRHLIAIEPGTSVETLEVGLCDVLGTLGAADAVERGYLEQLLARVRASRRGQSITKAEILFVEPERPRTRNGSRRRRVA